jgi:hypothetical protein
MSDANELLRINLHEVMSERSPERRRAAIERAYVEDVRHLIQKPNSLEQAHAVRKEPPSMI